MLQAMALTAAAQGVDCSVLRAEIENTSPRKTPPAQWSAAIREQSYEIERTKAYFESIGCNEGFVFSSGDTPQCQAIGARIARMQENLNRLQAQAQSDAGDERRRALIEDYNAQCGRGRAPADPSDDDATRPPQVIPVDPDTPSIMDSPSDDRAPQHAESKVLCVRQCDGGFFPIAYKATADKLDGLAKLCTALCPNAEVQLFTTRPDQDIDTAVATDGTPYSALPTAFKFQKSFDPACSCKPPHQTWVEALAAAEAMIDHGKNDVTVTPEISAAMAKPIPKPDPAAAPTAAKAETIPAVKGIKAAKATRRSKPPPIVVQVPPVGPPTTADGSDLDVTPKEPGEDIMREIRPTAPTL
jgi:hypothetical protein